LIKKRFAGNAKAEEILADHEADPDTYEKPLSKQLREFGVDRDEEILSAAAALLKAAGATGAKYQVGTIGKVGNLGDYGYIETMN
jgi:hypothetical protein